MKDKINNCQINQLTYRQIKTKDVYVISALIKFQLTQIHKLMIITTIRSINVPLCPCTYLTISTILSMAFKCIVEISRNMNVKTNNLGVIIFRLPNFIRLKIIVIRVIYALFVLVNRSKIVTIFTSKCNQYVASIISNLNSRILNLLISHRSSYNLDWIFLKITPSLHQQVTFLQIHPNIIRLLNLTET